MANCVFGLAFLVVIERAASAEDRWSLNSLFAWNSAFACDTRGYDFSKTKDQRWIQLGSALADIRSISGLDVQLPFKLESTKRPNTPILIDTTNGTV
jgi:hypothetical protein